MSPSVMCLAQEDKDLCEIRTIHVKQNKKKGMVIYPLYPSSVPVEKFLGLANSASLSESASSRYCERPTLKKCGWAIEEDT